MKTKKAYILYEYDQAQDDYNNIKEYYDIQELNRKEGYNIHPKTIYKYISKDIEHITHLINNKYVIIQEIIEEGATL